MIDQVAKHKILEWFPEGIDPSKTYMNISEDDYLKIFKAINKLIPFKKPSKNQSLILFLYAGCSKFDRWLSPTPTILPPNFVSIYKSFVNAFIKAEGGESVTLKFSNLK